MALVAIHMHEKQTLLKTIGKMRADGVFKNTIEYLRFPFFRNLECGTRIALDFPLTVFVGQNGCGKSSTLQALYGCPAGKSIESYWFSTHVDPIEEGEGGERHCVIYAYKDKQGNLLEVLKRRIKDANNPELWETSDPLKQYGMDPKAKRNEPLAKEVLYLDFRAIRSAFEINFQRLRATDEKPQDFLRYRSQFLRRALKHNRPYWRPQNKQPKHLTENELTEISAILGKTYTSGTLVFHHIFGEWGSSVKFTTSAATYSEAFAGSGETAVVLLVHEILGAAPETLILLDEPETSLHPGAQDRVQDFLLRQIKEKRHQVVISTHSQALVAGLPRESIKVFRRNADDRFNVLGDILPEESFFFIGQPIANKKRILVEDRLAKLLVETAIASMGDQISAVFEVDFFPGGHNAIKDDIARYCREKQWRNYVIFDGDQNPNIPVFDPGTLTVQEVGEQITEGISKLEGEILKHTKAKIKFPVDSDGKAAGGNKKQELDCRCAYLKFYAKNVFYFPWNSPEAATWHKETADQMIDLFVEPPGRAADLKGQIAAEVSFKKRFALLSDAISDGSDAARISTLHGMFVKGFKKRAPADFAALVTLIEKIRLL